MISSICSVYIYSGHTQNEHFGPYYESVEKHWLLCNALNEKKGFPWKVKKISGEEIISTLKNAILAETLFVIPAGESSKLDKAFSKEQNSLILESVKKGMRIFTTCGSSYWVSQEREWRDKCSDAPLKGETIRKKSPLPLFQGSAIGPLSYYPGQKYSSAFFHEAVELKSSSGTVKVLLSGGGAFFPSISCKTSIIATYPESELNRFGKDLSWSSAVIHFHCGKGRCVLSMVHPGYGAEDIDVEAYAKAFSQRKDDWQKIRDSLSSFDKRLAFFEDMISTLETKAD